MSWPLSHEFNEAVQNPPTAFADPDLKGGETVVGATGLPLPRSGNFADVYQVRAADGRDWAVKCFTRPVAGLAERYAQVSAALAAADLPFTVGFTFLAEGIRVGGAWRPAVKMEWVEGLLLNQVARENAAKPETLAKLGRLWVKLCKRLREAGVAHADIQHGNVLLVPGSRSGAYGLKLIDYDGMWVKALANTPSGESGHPSYQHPARAETRAYSPDVDRFPHLVVATALRGLAVGGAALWEKYDNGDNLLFTESDYQKPAESKLMRELWQTEDPAVQALVGRLAIACGKPIPQTPWLDQLAPEGEPALLDDAARREALAALGFATPVAVAAGWESPAVAPVVVQAELIPPPEPSRTPKKGRRLNATESEEAEPDRSRRYQPKRQVPVWVWGVAAGVLVCGVVGAALALRPKPEQTVQTKPEDEPGKPKESPAPKTPPPVTKDKDKTQPVVPPKPKDKEPDPLPKPKDPPGPREPVVMKRGWSVPADTEGTPATLRIHDQSILWGSPRTSMTALDLQTGTKRTTFAQIEFTGGDHFYPLDGGLVAKYAPDDKDVRTWDVKNGRIGLKIPVATIPPGAGDAKQKLAWLSPNGRSLVVARGTLAPASHPEVPFRVFTTDKTGTQVVGDTWTGGSVHFTADSKRVLVAQYAGRFRWFDLDTGKSTTLEYPPPADGQFHAVTDISADGKVLGYNGPELSETGSGPCLLDGTVGTVLHRFGKGYAANSPVAVSADGRFAAVLREPDGADVTVEVVSVPKGEPVARATVPASGAPPTFALSADARVLLVHDPKEGTLRRFDRP